MNCIHHPEIGAVAECQICKKSYCASCIGNIGKDPVCTDCAVSAVKQYSETCSNETRNISPVAAGWLALIPCVGAIYNGTYVRALYQFIGFVVINELMTGHMGFGFPATMIFYVFTIIDAVRTAKAIRNGTYTPEQFPLDRQLGGKLVTGLLLMLIGALFLLNNLDVNLEVIHRYWPVLIIAFGLYMVFSRKNGDEKVAEERRGPGMIR